MKISHVSPYKLKDSNLTYDTQQYQELMNNFENLIKTTQDRLTQNQYSIHESCSCSLEEQLQLLQQENEQLKQHLRKDCSNDQTQQIIKPSNEQLNSEQINQLISEFASKSEQQNKLISDQQEQIVHLQHQLIQEKNQHANTAMMLNVTQQEYEDYKNEKVRQNYKDFEISDKITKGYSELIQENQSLKLNNNKLLQTVENYKVALNQSYLVMSKPRQSVNVNIGQNYQIGKNQSQQTDDFLYSKTSILKERLNNHSQNIEKFIQQYIDKKKLRNKSVNEVKFYTDLNNWISQLANETKIFKHELSVFSEEKQGLTISLSSAEEELKQQQQNKEKAVSDLLLLKKENALLDQKILSLETQLNKQSSENTKYLQQLLEKEQKIQQFIGEANQYDIQYKIIVDSFQNEKRELQENIIGQRNKSLNLREQLSLKTTEINDIRIKYELAQQQQQVMIEKLQHQEIEFNQQQFKLTKIENELTSKQEENQNLAKSKQNLDVTYQHNLKEINQLKQHEIKLLEENQELLRANQLLDSEIAQLKIYSKQLQSDIRERNVQLSEMKTSLSELESQLYQNQNQSPDKSQIENTYMSSKIDDLESILKEKDQKIEEIEKLYHLTSYELRILQDYQQSLENNVNSYKGKVAKLESEIEQSNMNIKSPFRELSASFQSQSEDANISQLLIKINMLEEQIQLYQEQKTDIKQKQKSQQNSPQIQVKILSGEIQRLNQTIQLQNKKIHDLQYFIEKMITANESNRQLAAQILIQASQQGKIVENNIYNQMEGKAEEKSFTSGETFGFTVQSLNNFKESQKQFF